MLDYSAEQMKTSPRRRTNNQTTSDSITEIIRMPLHTQMNTSSSLLLLTAAQLKLVNGIAYHRYSPGPLSVPVDVPILSNSLQGQFLYLKTIILQLQGTKVL